MQEAKSITILSNKKEVVSRHLEVICFPTFRGHCGCILFDITEIEFTKDSSDAEKALMLYFGKLPDKNS